MIFNVQNHDFKHLKRCKSSYCGIALFLLIIMPFTVKNYGYGNVESRNSPSKAVNTNKMLREFDHFGSKELISKGVDYLNRNVLDSAYVCFSIARSKTADYSNDEMRDLYVSSLDGLGIVSFLFGNYSGAFQLFNKSIEVNPNHINAYMNLANIYQTFGEQQLARKYLETAYEKYLANGEIDAMSIAVSDIFEYDIIHDETSKSKDLASNFLKLDFPEQTQALEYARLLGKGLVEINEKKPQNAISLFRTGLNVIDDTPLFMRSRFRAVTLACLARAFDKAGMADSAIYYMRKGFYESSGNEHPDLTISTGKILGEFFDKRHMSDSATYYKYKALSIADSISTYSEYGKIKGLEMQKKIDDAQGDIEKYRTESKVRSFIITILSVMLILFICMLIWIKRKNRQLHNKDLHLYSAITGKSTENNPNLETDKADKREEEDISANKKEYRNLIDKEYGDRLIAKINAVMAERTDWLKPKFSLSDMAALVNDSPRNVSQIINERYSKNFSTFINEHRIHACINRLQESPDSLNYTIDAIASEFGFTNRSYFTRIFQAVIGMPPSAWMKIMREQRES